MRLTNEQTICFDLSELVHARLERQILFSVQQHAKGGFYPSIPEMVSH